MKEGKLIYNLVFISLSIFLGFFFFNADAFSQTIDTYEAEMNRSTYSHLERRSAAQQTTDALPTQKETKTEEDTSAVTGAITPKNPVATYTASDIATMSETEKKILVEQILAEAVQAKENRGSKFVPAKDGEITIVPFYSQFGDITSRQWQGVSCGVASLAMIIDYYQEDIAPDVLLQEGLRIGAYDDDAGWSHAGLIQLANKYGLEGATVGLSHLGTDGAFAELTKAVKKGPVIVSVHYTFEPTNPIPHLAVVTDIRDGLVYYNDPAALAGGGSITIDNFNKAWKKRYITIHPTS